MQDDRDDVLNELKEKSIVLAQAVFSSNRTYQFNKAKEMLRYLNFVEPTNGGILGDELSRFGAFR
jgi:hypothetical protein